MENHILIIDDDDSIRETLSLFLSSLNYKVSIASNGKTGLEILLKENPDLVITDLKMSGMSGIDVLKKIKEFSLQNQVIIITAYDDMQSTISAMRLGAYDYLEKPIDLEKFAVIIKRAIESKKLKEKLIGISEDSEDYNIEDYFIGKSSKIKEIFKTIGKISLNRINVLVQGEAGTGKEIISKIIHNNSITRAHPFITVNCNVLTEQQLEEELFGHAKNASGAFIDKKGKFEIASEGTILLDEISEISSNLQSKILKVLQNKEFQKIGDETILQLRARIIATTNRNLQELVEIGKFHQDLYWQLNICNIHIPPLRERREDIPNLVIHLLKKINRELHKNVRKITYEVMEILQRNDWIGNVRELENILLQAVILTKGDILEKQNILLSSNDNIEINKPATGINTKNRLLKKKKLDPSKINIDLKYIHELYGILFNIFSLVRHDIGNYLQNIQTYSLLLKNKKEKSIIDVETTLEKIISQSEKLEIFLRTIFQKSSDNDTIFQLVSKPTQLIKLIEENLDIRIMIFRKSPKKLEILFPENILFSIIRELINNAITYSGSNSDIILKWYLNENYFCCEVHDNGPGIKLINKNKKRLDDLYVQASGLRIIEKIITQLGGSLFFSKSNITGGTNVYFDMPVKAYYLGGKVYVK